MSNINGWGVYLKIKELSSRGDDEKPHINIEDLVAELKLDKELVREYLIALGILDFIEFTDHTKEVFVITDLGR